MSNYIKQNFENGKVLRAENLTLIEDSLLSMEEEINNKQHKTFTGAGAPTIQNIEIGSFYIDTNSIENNLYIYTTKGWTVFQDGEPGPQGPQGEKGEKGDPGKDAEGAILYTPQTLTEEQQAQARENIGASGIYIGPGDMPDGYSIQIDPNGQPTDLLTVTYTTQTPTPEQQAQARKNIGAISQEQLDQALENIPAGGGSIAVTDDGNGNVTINSQALTVTDDGNGNVSLN